MSLFVPCALTVIIETLFLYICGKRDGAFILMSVCVNVATNLTLNLLLRFLWAKGAELSLVVYPLECAVVLVEFLAYAAITEGGRGRLFLLTLLANALSYGAGIIIFGHI